MNKKQLLKIGVPEAAIEDAWKLIRSRSGPNSPGVHKDFLVANGILEDSWDLIRSSIAPVGARPAVDWKAVFEELVAVAKMSVDPKPADLDRLPLVKVSVPGDVAAFLDACRKALAAAPPPFHPGSASYRAWGRDIPDGAREQMENACRLPVAVRGALMPDCHKGYGLPVGGVLATRGAVIPYAVGVDIACRMKLTVLDLDPVVFDRDPTKLDRALWSNTSFGMGSERVNDRVYHPVLDDPAWDSNWIPFVRKSRLRDLAARQLGSSGSGNHFAELGEVRMTQKHAGADGYRARVGILTHSGSRGPGYKVAKHFSDLALQRHPELPDELKHLAWLDLNDEDGDEYWRAMELMGRYASACHEVIHERIIQALGAEPVFGIENHHNFAWRELHWVDEELRELVVHRKGATPASAGELGVIPGTMADPTFLVKGIGEGTSLRSAAHGAGRTQSRTKARASYDPERVRRKLEEGKVRVLEAGRDEAPAAYKPIREVMQDQQDLVEVIGGFYPRIVRMAPDEGAGPELGGDP